MNFQFIKFSTILLVTCTLLLVTSPVKAVVDPLSVPNNKFGIHIISPSVQEASEAAELVNYNGDWGYVTLLIQDNDRDLGKWQEFFNELRRRHLIPLIRIASHNDGPAWKKPNEGEEESWAEFLNNLIWPTKNRYVIVYNEPNHANEWGGAVDAPSYARTLDRYITALKIKNPDFFIISAGLDASAPQQLPAYQDEEEFLRQVDEAVPGIFERLDGWSSHSYPNPDFSGSPDDQGRGSVRTWVWEKQLLRSIGVKKDLPVFITETGWKHAEGLKTMGSYPGADKVADYFKTAFENAWNDPKIIAVTPFLLNYQEEPFDHFSFKKITGEKQKIRLQENILGTQFPQHYPQYELLRNLPKQTGQPARENKASLLGSNFSSTIAVSEQYNINIRVKNAGQTIWGDSGAVRLIPIEGGTNLGILGVSLPEEARIEPNGEYTFTVKLKAPNLGQYSGSLALFNDNRQFDSEPFTFNVNVKSPVILKINSHLAWKKTSAGEYLLSFLDGMTETVQQVILGEGGSSQQVQIHNLLPDTAYDFTLARSYYQKKTIHQTVQPGINALDFGELQPDIPSAILNPPELWKLLPMSN